ncbi:MAG: cytochrome-c oxidase, cbb3-type subunit III [Pseudomonadota bacterium]
MAMSEEDKRLDEETGQYTTGHKYDGIEELNTPLPKWWLWTFYATIVWGIAYTIAYPAWPLVSGATAGVLGYSSRAEVAQDIEDHEAKNAALVEELVAADIAAVDAGSDLHRYAVARGGSVFRAQCSQCHGSGAAGAVGYPNLLDNAWLWGGSVEEIAYTVQHGIRNETDPDARWSEMPAFGELLTRDEIALVVAHVQALPTGGAGGDAETLFLDNCSACHGEQGEGIPELGAPNLADAIWLYGGDEATLTETITYSRFGVMPAWGQRLAEADVRAVSLYVHALGGGE